jgi:hypothetical protein
MEGECSLPSSQQPVNGNFVGQMSPIHIPTSHLFRSHLKFIFVSKPISTEKIPSWEALRLSANQEIPRLLFIAIRTIVWPMLVYKISLLYLYTDCASLQSVRRFTMGWTVRGSNPSEGEIFRTHPDRPWGPPNLKRPGRGVDHPHASRAEVKERVAL